MNVGVSLIEVEIEEDATCSAKSVHRSSYVVQQEDLDDFVEKLLEEEEEGEE